MKTILTALLSLVLLGSAAAQKPLIKTQRQQKFQPNEKGEMALYLQIDQSFNRYGNVTNQEYFYMGTNGSLQSDRKIIYSYDGEGRHLSTLEYNGDNILESETKIYWDDKDNKNKIENITYTNGQKNTTVSYLLEYDANGNKKYEKYFEPDGTQWRGRTWYYNKENEVVKSFTWINKKNQPQREFLVDYMRDQRGDLVKSVSREKVNRKMYRKDIQLFSGNFMIRWRKYINGKLESEFINEYRDSVIIRTTKKGGRVVLQRKDAPSSIEEDTLNYAASDMVKTRKGKEDIWVTNSEYDAYGNIVITTQSINGKVVSVVQYDYDDYGNRTKTIKVDKEKNEKEEERLDYDDYGNVSKRVLLRNDKIISEERITYTYHDRQ